MKYKSRMMTALRRTPRTVLSLNVLEARDVPAAFVVSNTLDTGAGSLRAAITTANSTPGADTITFASSFNQPRTIALASTLSITDSVTVQGPSSGLLTLDAGGKVRAVNIDSPIGTATVKLNGFTIAHGSTSTNGGAIRVTGDNLIASDLRVANSTAGQGGGGVAGLSGADLTFNDCEIDANKAGRGGGVFIDDNGNVAMNRTRVNNNTATTSGGGLHADPGAELTLMECRIASNDGGTSGGGFSADNADVTVTGGLIAWNQADDSGGGGHMASGLLAGNNYMFLNTTVSNNKTTNTVSTGGGLRFLTDVLDPIEISNCTITGNTSGGGGSGGGVSTSLTSLMSVESTIVSGNSAGFSPDAATLALTRVETSAIGNMSGLLVDDDGGNYYSISPAELKLGPLQDNGGRYETHALATDSPVLNKGSNPENLTTDGRGGSYQRSINGNDIGAYERQSDFRVTNTNDSGPGSLRQILAEADAEPGVESITFDPAVFNTPQIILLASPIATGTGFEVHGPGADKLTLTAPGQRILTLDATANSAKQDYLFEGLRFADSGGAIDGGAILAANANVTIRDCVFDNNTGNGGAVHSTKGSLTIDRTTFHANHGGMNDNGGAIHSDGTLSISNTTLDANSTGGRGGAVYLGSSLGGAAAVQVSNSTLSGNTAGGSGGAIGIEFLGGVVALESSTVVGNLAASGGGLAVEASASAAFLLDNSIASGNNATLTGLDIFSGASVSYSESAVGSPGGFAPTDRGGNLPFFSTLLLGPLAKNGGPTRTHSPMAGSPLLDAGVNLGGKATDQRGFPRITGSAADIGAVEAQNGPRVLSVVVDNGAGQHSKIRSLRINFSSEIALATGAVELSRVNANGTVTPVAINVDLSSSMPGQTVAVLTWTADTENTQFGSLKDGSYRLTVHSVLAVDSFGRVLDGDGDGSNGDDFNRTIRRIFGDVNGDGTVDATDFAAFGNAFGSSTVNSNYLEVVDFQGDGTVDASDLAEFGNRFGITLS